MNDMKEIVTDIRSFRDLRANGSTCVDRTAMRVPSGGMSIGTRLCSVLALFFSLTPVVRAEVVPPDGFAMLNIVPFSPGREEVAADDACAYVARTGNDIVLYSLTLHPQGKPASAAVDRAVESYRKFAALLKGRAVRPGILLQAIVGHWPRTDREIEPWQRTVNLDGAPVRFCPFDPGYRAYIRETAEKLAACRPCLVLSDDDVRAFSPLAECFCPLHTAAFNRRTGRNLTPEAFRALVKGCDRQSPEHKAFTDLQLETVLSVCRALREGYDAVDPTMPSGICLPSWVWEVARGKDYAKAVAAKGQRPFLRLPNGRYTETSPKGDLHGDILGTQFMQDLYGDEALLLDEADTWPHNLWSKSAVAMHAKLAATAFLGLNGAKLWYVNGHKGAYPVSRAYTDVLAAHRGYHAAIARAVCGGTMCEGILIPCRSGFPFNAVSDLRRVFAYDDRNWATCVFGQFGVPFRATADLGRNAVYALAGAQAVAAFSDDDLRRLLSRRLLVDGKATVALAKRGFAALTGVEVVDGKQSFVCERDERTGDEISYPATVAVSRFKPVAGAKVLSSFIWRAYPGAPSYDRVAPAAVLHANALGGTVLCAAYHTQMGQSYSHSEARKAWLLRRLADLNDGVTPDGIVTDEHNAMALVRTAKDGSRLFFVSNLGFDPFPSVSVTCAARPKEVSVLAPTGTWQQVDPDWTEGVLTVRTPMPCYEVAVLKVRFGRGLSILRLFFGLAVPTTATIAGAGADHLPTGTSLAERLARGAGG